MGSLIVGLGNPGKTYEMTRHNLGRLSVQALAKDLGSTWKYEARFEGQRCHVQYEGHDADLLLPETYMNESGRAVRSFLDFYKLPADSVVVVVDDMALPFGQMRLRLSGTAGGHNGLKSIEAHLGTKDYCRFRLGIGKDCQQGDVDWVLGHFTKAEKEQMVDLISAAKECLKKLICKEFQKVASQVNQKVSPGAQE